MVLIRHPRQPKTVVFLHRCLICAVLLQVTIISDDCTINASYPQPQPYNLSLSLSLTLSLSLSLSLSLIALALASDSGINYDHK